MSRRTSNANKAVLEAWKRERELVLEGKGTRDWMPEQQKSIIEKGKAYNIDGKAIEGHHMKSVECFPDYQGNADNIQFLSKDEHIMAHCGNFQNPTNGYYNPMTGATLKFDENTLIPCDIIELSNPIVKQASNTATDDEELILDSKEELNTTQKSADENASSKNQESTKKYQSSQKFSNKKKIIFDELKTKAKELGQIAWDNKEVIAREAIKLAVSVAITKGSGSGGSGTSGVGQPNINLNQAADLGRNIIDRASPVEHMVKGYTRIQNGREIHVAPYIRGKK